MTQTAYFLGLDFGTESVRAIVADRRGATAAAAVAAYRHGQIVTESAAAREFFEQPLPHTYALQHPWDWLESSAAATREAVAKAGIEAGAIAGIGVDFTSCTMLPCTSEGRPLCLAWEPGPGKGAGAPPRSGLASDPHA